ncbi:MAG TPA: EAL domain-containing protein [Beijerinckiaceae bacterium]|nr:EAL domain-containing protein [Beijerinckiaceae bacterium]
MTRKIGLRAGAGQSVAIIAGGVSALLLAVALLLVLAPGNPALIALSAITGASVALAAKALLRARRLEAQAAKLSGDLDIVSLRLLRLEAAPAMAAKEAKPDARLANSVDEITAEIGLMGGILRDLANAVAAHDRDLASARGGIGRSAPPRPAPAPTRADPAPAPEPRPVETPAAKPARAVPEPGPDRPVAAILDAFAADRLELHLQPVVALPQRKVRFYEALARLRLADETLLVPAEFLPVLEERRLMPELDRKVLARTATIARHLASRGSDALVACNIAPASLAEPGFLREFGRLIDAYPDVPGRLILEISQRCWRTLDAEKAGALAQLRDRGLSFALDRATDLRLDPLSLADRGVRLVKLPAELLLQPETLRGLDIEIHDLAAVLARAGIKLVAERVEREEDVPDLLDLDVPMAQGFVFAPPPPSAPRCWARRRRKPSGSRPPRPRSRRSRRPRPRKGRRGCPSAPSCAARAEPARGAASGWKRALFDHLVGEEPQAGWNFKPERPGRPAVDDELELARLLDRQIGGLGPLQYLVHIGGGRR